MSCSWIRECVKSIYCILYVIKLTRVDKIVRVVYNLLIKKRWSHEMEWIILVVMIMMTMQRWNEEFKCLPRQFPNGRSTEVIPSSKHKLQITLTTIIQKHHKFHIYNTHFHCYIFISPDKFIQSFNLINFMAVNSNKVKKRVKKFNWIVKQNN